MRFAHRLTGVRIFERNQRIGNQAGRNRGSRRRMAHRHPCHPEKFQAGFRQRRPPGLTQRFEGCRNAIQFSVHGGHHHLKRFGFAPRPGDLHSGRACQRAGWRRTHGCGQCGQLDVRVGGLPGCGQVQQECGAHDGYQNSIHGGKSDIDGFHGFTCLTPTDRAESKARQTLM